MTMAVKGYLLSKLYRVDPNVIQVHGISQRTQSCNNCDKGGRMKTYVPQVHENIWFFKTR